ncbi:unnamed protein product [Gadus morhua 'NCC']
MQLAGGAWGENAPPRTQAHHCLPCSLLQDNTGPPGLTASTRCRGCEAHCSRPLSMEQWCWRQVGAGDSPLQRGGVLLWTPAGHNNPRRYQEEPETRRYQRPGGTRDQEEPETRRNQRPGGTRDQEEPETRRNQRPGGTRDQEEPETRRYQKPVGTRNQEEPETRRYQRPGGTRDKEVPETRRNHRPGGTRDQEEPETRRNQRPEGPETRRYQRRPGGTRGDQEGPEETRRNQRPGGTRDQEEPETRRYQSPGGTRGDQEEPEESRMYQRPGAGGPQAGSPSRGSTGRLHRPRATGAKPITVIQKTSELEILCGLKSGPTPNLHHRHRCTALAFLSTGGVKKTLQTSQMDPSMRAPSRTSKAPGSQLLPQHSWPVSLNQGQTDRQTDRQADRPPAKHPEAWCTSR